MGFLEGLGDFMGSLVAKAQAEQEAFELYRGDYEHMSRKQLISEYNKLKEEKDKLFRSPETAMRYETVRRLLRQMNENNG